MDTLPRLTDMLLFVFIVRHFFYTSIDYRSFACSLKAWRAEARRAVRPLTEKYKLTNGRSGDFSAKRQKNSPAPHVYLHEQARLESLCGRNKLKLSIRAGENGHQHIGNEIN